MLTPLGVTTVQDVDVVTVEAIIAQASVLRPHFKPINHNHPGDITIIIDQDPDHQGVMTLRESKTEMVASTEVVATAVHPPHPGLTLLLLRINNISNTITTIIVAHPTAPHLPVRQLCTGRHHQDITKKVKESKEGEMELILMRVINII